MNDDEWRAKVDEHLLRDLIEDLQERVKEIDLILRGERGKGGLIAEYDKHDDRLTRLYAVIFQDPTGQKGLLHDVDYLMGRKSDRDKSNQYRWQSWTAIAIAIISSITTVVLSWDKIKKNFPFDREGVTATRVVRIKSPKKIVRVRVIPAPSVEEEPAPE